MTGRLAELARRFQDVINHITNKPFTWGQGNGTLSDQTDLQAALDEKADFSEVKQRIELPEGDGATDNVRWYRVATMLRSTRNNCNITIVGMGRILNDNATDVTHLDVMQFNDSDPTINYSQIRGSSGALNQGRFVVTNDGTEIGIYIAVGRFGNATVFANNFMRSGDDRTKLESTQIAEGVSIPSSIAPHVVFDSSIDVENAQLRTGETKINSALLNPLSSAPPATEGRIYFDNAIKKFRGYDGTSWVDL